MTSEHAVSGVGYAFVRELSVTECIALELTFAQDRCEMAVIEDFLTAIEAPMLMQRLPESWSDVVELVGRLSPVALIAWSQGLS